ncbi:MULTISPECIES: fibrobacter succinogenes major paralogous domain-containing protein [unclassified Carboxylicivirga]|uniref:fibrobacter succinogenes major paralogous domain-containing protein n=1 Tax=Carboxylicivirga TaxID=1628153 RepID=UPI003D3597D9
MKPEKYILILFAALLIISCEEERLANPTISTVKVNNIGASEAIGGGTIDADGILPVLSRGVCWGLISNPTLGDSYTMDGKGVGSYESMLTNLNANRQYFVRAYYTNENDTVYGDQLEFTTVDYIMFNPGLKYGSVEDIDGNEYKTIQIGDQIWMAENLKTTRYQNGDPIDHLTDINKWGHFQINTGAYIYYDNDIINKDIHGALYNWHAAADTRNIAPAGWRVPSKDDWQKLIDYLNSYANDNYGYKLRETTSAHWYFNAQMRMVSTNSTGLTSIPSGKAVGGKFMDKGNSCAYYWTSTGTLDGSSCIYLHDNIIIDYMQPNARGFSIRCIKN